MTAVSASPASAHPTRDTVLADEARAAMRAAPERTYVSAAGQAVRVSSAAFTEVEIRPLVETLTSFPHGEELSALRLYVATPSELDRACGSRAMACYDPYAERIFISGMPDQSSGVPRDFVLAHEYGHHVANHRANSPWWALEWGPKRWATEMGVCEGVKAGELHPGDQGAHYWSNPGEGFAQAYAHMVYPSATVPWYYDARLAPDAEAIAAVRLDVSHPWRGPALVRPTLRLGSRFRTKVVTLSTPLDGRMRVWVTERGGREVTIRLLAADGPRVLARSTDSGSREKLSFDVCGEERVRLKLRARRGAGRFVGGKFVVWVRRP